MLKIDIMGIGIPPPRLWVYTFIRFTGIVVFIIVLGIVFGVGVSFLPA